MPWGTASWSLIMVTGSGTGVKVEGDTTAKKKSKARSPFLGRWRVVRMSAWEDEYFDEEVQAFFKFEETGSGSFQFGYLQGVMDCRTTSREGKSAVEFSWEGGDGADGTSLTGRGWAVLQEAKLLVLGHG